MTKFYRIFTGAPPATRSVKFVEYSSSWQTVSSRDLSTPLPLATLEEAGHRISLLYQTVIFEEGEDDQDRSEEWESGQITGWPPANPAEAATRVAVTSVDDLSRFSETFDTDQTYDNTGIQSDGSSISCFPIFNFSLNAVTSLFSIIQSRKFGTPSTKATLLLGVLEVDGPSYVTIKTGVHAGSEASLLKLIVGDEQGAMCKVVAWRETADVWGGITNEPALKRGDVVLFEHVLVSGSSQQDRHDADSNVQITASPNLKSHAQICYRTLPYTYEDRKLRPDLRLADSVPTVRKVGEVVTWIERMAGIHATV